MDSQLELQDLEFLRQKARHYHSIDTRNQELQQELEVCQKSLQNQVAPRPSNPDEDRQRLLELQSKVSAYEDICHYYSKRIHTYEKVLKKLRMDPAKARFTTESPERNAFKEGKPQDLSESTVRQRLDEHVKQVEKALAEREGENQFFKEKIMDLESVLNRSDKMGDSEWAFRKEKEKLQDQVQYQQARIDQLIDMLLSNKIDLNTGLPHSSSNSKQKRGSTDVKNAGRAPANEEDYSSSDDWEGNGAQRPPGLQEKRAGLPEDESDGRVIEEEEFMSSPMLQGNNLGSKQAGPGQSEGLTKSGFEEVPHRSSRPESSDANEIQTLGSRGIRGEGGPKRAGFGGDSQKADQNEEGWKQKYENLNIEHEKQLDELKVKFTELVQGKIVSVQILWALFCQSDSFLSLT